MNYIYIKIIMLLYSYNQHVILVVVFKTFLIIGKFMYSCRKAIT